MTRTIDESLDAIVTQLQYINENLKEIISALRQER